MSHSLKRSITQLNESVTKVVDFKTMLVNIIPSNIVDAMAKSDLLAVIFFAILFGAAAGAIGKKSEPAMKFMESVANIMFKLTQMVMVTAPMVYSH